MSRRREVALALVSHCDWRHARARARGRASPDTRQRRTRTFVYPRRRFRRSRRRIVRSARGTHRRRLRWRTSFKTSLSRSPARSPAFVGTLRFERFSSRSRSTTRKTTCEPQLDGELRSLDLRGSPSPLRRTHIATSSNGSSAAGSCTRSIDSRSTSAWPSCSARSKSEPAPRSPRSSVRPRAPFAPAFSTRNESSARSFGRPERNDERRSPPR